MAELVRKRNATSALEDVAKRLRIQTAEYEDHQTRYDGQDNDDDNHSQYSDGQKSEDGTIETAGTPVTPFSPSPKNPSDLKTIKCTYEGCTKAFNRPARLASHLRSHTNERPFVCTYIDCDKTYMEEKHLKQHIKGSHTHEKPFPCEWEGCDKSFVTSTRLRRHQDVHQGRERFRCTAYPPCDQSFRKHQTLQRHIRADHLQLTPFPCIHFDDDTQTTCNAEFDTGTALRKHENRVHGTLRFWCDECSTASAFNGEGPQQQVGFRTKNELSKHIRTEHSSCIFCDLKFITQALLEKHIETHHCGIAAKNNLAERKIIPCPHTGCLKTFTKKYNLAVHVRSAHDGQRFICSQSASSYPFKSPDVLSWTGHDACGKKFVSKVNLEDHIRTQHLGLPSVINAKKIKGPGSRKKGVKSAPGNDDLDTLNTLTGASYQNQARNIPCLVAGCEWLFIRQYDLEQHLRLKHNLSTAAVENATRPPNSDPYDRDTMDQMYDQADLEWEMETRQAAAEDRDNETPFWIGAGDENMDDEEVGGADVWFQEQREVRNWIGRAADSSSYDGLIDPSLESA